MLRDAAELTTLTGASTTTTKIRKRCAVSPSGASPDRQRRALRLRRGVRLIGGHRRGVGTSASPCERSSGKKKRMSESSWNRHCRHADAETTRSTASARKLVSALWQVNKGDGDGALEEEEGIGWDAAAARRSSDHHRRCASLEVSGGYFCGLLCCACAIGCSFPAAIVQTSNLILLLFFPVVVKDFEKEEQGSEG